MKKNRSIGVIVLMAVFFLNTANVSASSDIAPTTPAPTREKVIKYSKRCAIVLAILTPFVGGFIYSGHVYNQTAKAGALEESAIKHIEAMKTSSAGRPELLTLLHEIDDTILNSVKQGPDKNDYGQPVFHGFDLAQIEHRRELLKQLEEYIQSTPMSQEEIAVTKEYVEFLKQMIVVARKFKWDVMDRFISTGHYRFFPAEHFDPDRVEQILQILQTKTPVASSGENSGG